MCNLECFSADCEWDRMDCGCAADCLTSEYGQCKSACLVANCNYDSMQGYPQCDDIARIAAQYYQLSTGNFSNIYTYDTVCAKQSSSCLPALWLQSFTSCVPECDSTECVYSFGNCGASSSTGCTSLKHCLKCELKGLPSCLKCLSGYVNFYGVCMSRCPVGYEIHDLVADLCYPLMDNSTENSPQVVYVQSGESEEGDGSYLYPFDSISIALTSIRTKYTVIYLLSGEHSLTQASFSPYLSSLSAQFQLKSALTALSGYSVLVTAWTCAEDTNSPPHAQCASTRPTILYQNLHPVVWNIYGNFSITGVDLEGGTSLIPGCSTDMCSYCSYVTVLTGGSVISDQSVRMAPGTFAPSATCTKFHENGFFFISEGAVFTLKNLEIANFRQEFSSLINMTSASILLQNVSLSNILISATLFSPLTSFISTKSLIFQSNPSQQLYLPGQIQLIDVTATLLGNGFEYHLDLIQGGFMNIEGLETVLIVRLSVSFSIIQGGFLLNIGNFSQLKIADCVFNSVFAGQSMVKIAPIVKLSSEYIVDGLPYDYYLDHLVITNVSLLNCSSFQYTSSTEALISIVFTNEIYSTRVENLVIRNSYSSGYLLFLTNIGNLLASDKANVRSGVILATGERIQFILPKKWVLLRDIRISSSVSAGEGVLSLISLPNVEIVGLNVTDSGDAFESESVNVKTIKGLIENSGSYMSIPVKIERIAHCGRLISLEKLYNVSLANSALKNTTCLEEISTPGLYITNLEGDFLANQLSFHAVNTLSTALPCCLFINTSGHISLSAISIVNCIMQDEGAIVVQRAGPAGVDIQDSVLQGNKAQGALLQVLAAYILRVQNCSITHNYSPSNIGIYFKPELNLDSAAVSFTDIRFEDNTGLLVSLMNDVNDPVPILMSLHSLNYFRNIGVTISLDSSNVMLAGSAITNCKFVNNTPHKEVTLLSFQHGSLQVKDCLFERNWSDDKGCLGVVFMWDGLNKYVSITSCVFRYNKCPGVHYTSDTHTALLILQGNTYEYNQVSAIYTSGGIFTDDNSVFLATNASAIALDNGSQGTISQATFSHNAALHGGAIYIEGESNCLLKACNFVNNTAEEFGGAIYVEQASKLIGEGLNFRENRAGIRGSTVYFFGTTQQNQLSNCKFQDNWSAEGGTIVILSSILTLSASTISTNQAPIASGLLCYFSTVTVSNCSFSHQQADTGVFIYCAMESVLRVQNSSFSHGNAAIKGGAIYILSAVVSIDGCVFTDLEGRHGAMMAVNARAVFNVTNTRVEGVSAYTDLGGVIYSMESSGFVENCTFRDYENGAIVGYQLLSLSVFSTNFLSKNYLDGTASKGAGLRCTECQSITVQKSLFRSLTGNEGVAMYITTSSESPIDAPVTVVNCLFRDIYGKQTGAVAIDNLNAVISYSTFDNCQATDSATGCGGAIALSCAGTESPCEVTVSMCEFEGNSAGRQGGSISWANFQPLITASNFNNGQAFYGPDIASYPLELRLVAVMGNGVVDDNLGRDSAGNPIQGRLNSLGSGQIASQFLEIALLDHYNQTVVTDDKSTATLLPSPDSSVIGNMSVTALKGMYIFKDFGVTAVPGNSTLLYVRTSGIDSSKIRNFTEEMTFVTTIAIRAEMRLCHIGETLLNDQCVVCPVGKYSLDPAQSCQDCPDGAICYGNYTMVPKAGYWRGDALSPLFWKCPYANACLGSPEPPKALELQGKCADGYFGNLCNGCISGFSRQSTTECAKCPPVYQNAIRVTGIGLGIFIALIIIVRTAINSAKKVRSYYSIFIKILLNYIQLVMLTASFQLQWPTYVQELFKIQQSAGSVTEQIFSIDCFLDNSETDTQARTVRSKLIMLSILPLLLLGGSIVVWFPLAVIMRKFAYLKNELATTMVVLFFLVHPSLVKFMFDYFNCRRLDEGELWMSSYLNIPCWDSTYYKYAWIVAVPSIMVWGIGVPSLCLLILWKRKRMLDLTEMKLRLGFLYNGYEYSKFYWEFVILYRKIAIISIAVFLTNISTSIQALTAMLVLLAAFALQSKHQPYVVNTMNQLELRAILVAAVTIYCGLYYITNDLDGNSQLILFIIIAAVNGYFILYWLLKVCKAGLLALTKRFRFLDNLFRKGAYQVNPNTLVPGSMDMSSATHKLGDSSANISRVYESDSISHSRVHNPSSLQGESGALPPDNSSISQVERSS